LIQAALNEATALGQGVGMNLMFAARAVLFNSLGRHEEAVEAARAATSEPTEIGPTKWALAELVEASVRSGNVGLGTAAFDQLSAMTEASGTDYALGVRAWRGALLQQGESAERLYAEATDRLSRTRMRVDHARARLAHGEWLRRQGRRVEARAELRL